MILGAVASRFLGQDEYPWEHTCRVKCCDCRARVRIFEASSGLKFSGN